MINLKLEIRVADSAGYGFVIRLAHLKFYLLRR